MDIIGSEDKFILQHSGEIAIPPSFPRLYGPIIGSKALGVYLSLSSIPSSMAPHEASELLRGCWSTLQDLQGSLTLLEGIGLVDSYKDEKAGVYCLLMNPPLPAESFLSSELLSRQLSNSLGEGEFKTLKLELLGEKLPLDTFVRIGSRFEDSYGLFPNKQKIKTLVRFDRSKFDKSFALSSGFQASSLSDEEIRKISELSAFYSVDDDAVGQVAAGSYSAHEKFGNRIDFQSFEKSLGIIANGLPYLRKRAKSSVLSKDNTSRKADAIRLFDSVSPIEYLSYVQGGGQISRFDAALARKVSLQMGLSFPATNALLSFTLSKFHDSLPPKYVEDMAGVLLRNDITTSREAIEFLVSYEKSLAKKKKEKQEYNSKWHRSQYSDQGKYSDDGEESKASTDSDDDE